MRFIVADDHAGMSRSATDELAAVIASNPSAAVPVATGTTPVRTYPVG